MRDWKNTALVIVDVQNDFCPGGALAVDDGDLVIDPINYIINEALEKDAEIFATKDFHPVKTKHFLKWPPHCVQGTMGQEFHKNLLLMSDNFAFNLHWYRENVFYKGQSASDDGYSAFDGYNTKGQSFIEILSARSISKLVVVGLATDYCVRATALDGVVRGFDVTVLLPCCKAVDPKTEAEAIDEMDRFGVDLEKEAA